MQFERRLVGEQCVAGDLALVATDRRGLDAREIHAVTVGRADAFRYGWDAAPPSNGIGRRLASWLAALAGLRRVTPFADERLETLRLFACMMRRSERGLDDMAARLLAAGFTPTALHQATNLALA